MDPIQRPNNIDLVNPIYDALRCAAAILDFRAKRDRWGIEVALGELIDRTAFATNLEAYALVRVTWGSKMRAPMLGDPVFVGGTNENDWIDSPFTVFRGVPFLVVRGWSIGGLVESPSMYLAHCIINGMFSENESVVADPGDKSALVNQLIRIGPWNHRLSDVEVDFLRSQVR